MPEAPPPFDAVPSTASLVQSRSSVLRALRSAEFWRPRSLHPIARVFLLVVVGVLICIAVGFSLAAGGPRRDDVLSLVLYAAVAMFVWQPLTAAIVVMLVCTLGAVFSGGGGDLLELAITLGLVAATCTWWVIVAHVVLLGILTVGVSIDGSALSSGGVYGIAGIAAIALLIGIAFRLVAAREAALVSERSRAVEDLEALAKEQQERIADELHDGIAHDLTLVLFHARALPKQTDDEARGTSLATIESAAEKALVNIQSLLTLLRDTTSVSSTDDDAEDDSDIVGAARSLGDLLNNAGIPTTVSTPSTPLDAGSPARRALVETATEAVTNILKHAPGSRRASIEVHSRSGTVALVVENVAPSGAGTTTGRGGGRGLRRARERLAQHGGELTAGPAADGWLLRATVSAEPRTTS